MASFQQTTLLLVALVACVSCESFFTVCPASSSISSPASAAVVLPFVEQTITWDASALTYSAVTIELWEADQASADDFIATISVSTANDGSFSWVPENYIDASGSDELYLFISEPNYTAASFSLFGFCFEMDVSRISDVIADSVILVSVASSHATDTTVQMWPTSDPSDITTQSKSFQEVSEILDTVIVFDDLSASASYTYRYRLSYDGSIESDWIETVTVSTYDALECNNDVLSAFFAASAYYDWDVSVPQFDWCGSWETVFVFNSFTDHVFLHRNVDSDLLVVSHRGTEVSGSSAVADWLDNISLFLVDCSGTDEFRSIGCVSGALVSSSFLEAYLDAGADDLLDAMIDEAANGYDRLLLTGHSQGAGLAIVNLLDTDREDIFEQYDLITFGSLSVGNQAFVDQAAGILTSSTRYVQSVGESTDIVASLGSLGSVHLGAPTFVPCVTTPACHSMPDYVDGVFNSNAAIVQSSGSGSAAGSPLSNSFSPMSVSGSPGDNSPTSDSPNSQSRASFSFSPSGNDGSSVASHLAVSCVLGLSVLAIFI